MESIKHATTAASAQAMATWKPVVVPDEGGSRGIVIDGVCCLIYRQGDLDDFLYAKIEYLLENPEKRDDLGYNAKQRAFHFSWDKACRILISELVSNKATHTVG